MPSIPFIAAPLTLLQAYTVDNSTVAALFDYPVNLASGTYTITKGADFRTVTQVGLGAHTDEVYLYLNAPLTSGFWTLTVTGVQAGAPPVTISPNPSTLIFFVGAGVAVLPAPPPFSGQNLDAEAFIRREIPSSMTGNAWGALIKALATAEQPAWDNAPSVEKNMFLATAVDGYLDRRAAGAGIERPLDVGMPDEPFRDLVIELMTGQVTIISFLRVLAVFYGLSGTHAHLASTVAPFVLADSQTLTIHFDGIDDVLVTFKVADFTDITLATATEVAGVLNRTFLMGGYKHFALIEREPITGFDQVVVYSGTPGARSSLQFDAGAAQAALAFPTTLARLLGQTRASYLLSRGDTEVEVVFPATTDVVARDITSACYLTDYVDPNVNNLYGYGIYGASIYGFFVTGIPLPGVGPYLYEAISHGLSLTETTTTATPKLEAGQQYRLLAVASSTGFPDAPGWVVFGYGYDYQVGPVPYLGTAGPNAILLDNRFTFPVDVPAGARVNLLTSDKAPVPAFDEPGDFWLTDSPAGRVAAEATIDEVAAAGYTVLKTILYPGDVGLGNAGNPTHGVPAISDIVECYGGSALDAELALARSS